MLQELMTARINELRASEKTIATRMTWEQVSRIDRLERALRTAQVKLHFLPNLSAKAN